MGALALVAVAGAAVSAYGQGQAGKSQANYYNYLSQTSRLNAGLAEAEGAAQGRQINEQALSEQRGLNTRISRTIGAQKAGLVNGAGASSRTAQDIISDTINQGDVDQEALSYNTNVRAKNAEIGAETQALNYGTQASGYSSAGGNAMAASRLGQTQSILGGASSIAQSYWMANVYSGKYSQSNLNTPSRGTAGIDY